MSKRIKKSRLHKYPYPDKIQIDKASLELKLREYKAAIKSGFAWRDLLFLIPAWAILCTSNFNSIWLLSEEALKGIYLAFMLIGTVDLIKNKLFKKITNMNEDVSMTIDKITNECK